MDSVPPGIKSLFFLPKAIDPTGGNSEDSNKM